MEIKYHRLVSGRLYKYIHNTHKLLLKQDPKFYEFNKRSVHKEINGIQIRSSPLPFSARITSVQIRKCQSNHRFSMQLDRVHIWSGFMLLSSF